ncbi:MAG: hypothetical protein LBD67_09430 [Candidatus Accumulibacter sp.]|jgi:phage terminase large subunit GpA-like protein|nr:hypothetical protein [Accumulibacter sp.]
MNPSVQAALNALIARVFAVLRPRAPLMPLEWAEKYRYLSAEENPDFAGPFRTENVPALRGVLAACGRPGVRRVVAQKSAQIGYIAF